jgi:hypothetical protein
MTTTITEPVVIDSMPDTEYHAHPALSVSGARLLLPPSCPAIYRWQQDHGRDPKRAWDIGHAAHRLVLGAGPELEVVDAADWRTKAARELRDKARETGRVPILAHEFEAVSDMAYALRQHPIAGELLNPETMRPEVSIFWRDPLSDVMRRARLDAISKPDADGEMVVVDYKSTRSANLDHISRAMWTYGYAMQAAWYLDAAISAAREPWDAKRFLFVFQESSPPYVVSVVQPDSTALHIGEERNKQALGVYAACVESDTWPGHVPADQIPYVGLPSWAERQHDTDIEEVTL